MEAAMPDYESVYDDDVTAAVRDTEREIFDAAVGNDELNGDENQLLEDLSQSEGWDGLPLSDEEQIHRAAFGDTTGTNYDRPIAMHNELTLAAENAQLHDQVNWQNQYITEYITQPQREAAQEGRRESFRQHMEQHGFFGGYENEKIDRLIAASDARNQHTGALEAERINASMSAAHC
jgi:hypothetical protein